MPVVGILLNVLFAILGVVVAIWYAIDHCDDHPILGGIGAVCIWAILQIIVNCVIY